MAPWFFWQAVRSTARLGTVSQILIFLPSHSPRYRPMPFFYSPCFFHTCADTWNPRAALGSPALPLLQVPVHSFLLLVCFNAFSQTIHPWIITASSWWGWILRWSSPGFIVMEGMSSLLVAQKLGQIGKAYVNEGENVVWQFGLLIAAAAGYVASAWWIVEAYPAAASSPLSSTLLGVAMTAFIFLTIIGFVVRRTNIIESSCLALFLAYNVWLCGFDQISNWAPPVAYTPLLDNILPHLQTLVNFFSNTLPKPVLVALVYRLIVLHFASRILPTIGADDWESEAGDDDNVWDGRATSRLTKLLLTYRQAIFITVYSHLLLLDHASQIWWRWMNIFFTLVLWGIELSVSSDDITKEWKVE
ncbi:hypothetical protein BC629DRAFT_833927 [Irpex lacteus]|nr:hypothetical protein BC629DRAFT_833927 [Irpex lacteus]